MSDAVAAGNAGGMIRSAVQSARASHVAELTAAPEQLLRRAAEAGEWPGEEHVNRVAEYSRALAQYLGLSRREVREIARSARLHDVGKIVVPGHILRKRGPLSRCEFALIRLHTLCGAGIIGPHPGRKMAREIALYHHEKWDGSGYPMRLRGEEIPLPARIVGLADVYDALRTRRPYKPPVDHHRARHIIFTGDGRTQPDHFCPDVLRAFGAVHEEFSAIYARSGRSSRG